jgi:two-component system, chemotaxis family, chemotaxis protein CheY
MKKVLIIDDSPFARNYHSNIMKLANFEADGVCNGVEALERILFNQYDLILCDINMNVMDGVSFIKEFRSLGNETPIIVITTMEELKQKSAGFEAGANMYIVKPVTPEYLLENVKLILGN